MTPKSAKDPTPARQHAGTAGPDPSVPAQPSSPATTLKIDAHVVRNWLLALAGLFALASIAQQLYSFIGSDFAPDPVMGTTFPFDARLDLSPISWLTTVLLLMCSLLLLLSYLRTKAAGGPRVGQWGALSIIFLVLSIDEAIEFHERSVSPWVVSAIGAPEGIFFYAWLVPAVVLGSLVGWLFLGFVLDLPNRTRRLVVTGGLTVLGAGIGLEMLEGLLVDTHGISVDSFLLASLITAEEFLEMLGLTLIVFGLLVYLSDQRAVLQVTFSQPSLRRPDVPHEVRDGTEVGASRGPDERPTQDPN